MPRESDDSEAVGPVFVAAVLPACRARRSADGAWPNATTPCDQTSATSARAPGGADPGSFSRNVVARPSSAGSRPNARGAAAREYRLGRIRENSSTGAAPARD